MAAGEYVSVSSQSDTEDADLALEGRQLASEPDFEKTELTRIYISRGLDSDLATRVADALMAKDALDAHARDELAIHERTRVRPIQAAFASAAAFAVGAVMPVVLAGLLPESMMQPVVAGVTLLALLVLGGSAARMGGAPPLRGALRVMLWGALAMAVTALVGWAFA